MVVLYVWLSCMHFTSVLPVSGLQSTRWQRLQPPRVSYASLRESKREIGADENPQKRRRRAQGSNMRRHGTKKKVNKHTSTAASRCCIKSFNITSNMSLCMYALLSCSGLPGAGQEVPKVCANIVHKFKSAYVAVWHSG